MYEWRKLSRVLSRISGKDFIERNVDLKTWKGWMFLLLARLVGLVLGALFGYLRLLFF